MVPFNWVTMDPLFRVPENDALPMEEVRIHSVEVDSYPDGDRVSVTLHVTPFQVPPEFDSTIKNATRFDVANVNLLELQSNTQEVFIHLTIPIPSRPLPVQVDMIHPEMGIVDQVETSSTDPDPDSSEKG